MAKRERIQKQASRREEETETENVETETTSTEANPLLDDEILDEIDSVLEENAKDFVDQFLQKGGQAVIGEGVNLGTIKNISERCRTLFLLHSRRLRNGLLGIHGRLVSQRVRPILV